MYSHQLSARTTCRHKAWINEAVIPQLHFTQILERLLYASPCRLSHAQIMNSILINVRRPSNMEYVKVVRASFSKHCPARHCQQIHINMCCSWLTAHPTCEHRSCINKAIIPKQHCTQILERRSSASPRRLSHAQIMN